MKKNICKTWDCDLPVKTNRSSFCTDKCNVRHNGYIKRYGGNGTPQYKTTTCKYSKCNNTFLKKTYNKIYCSRKCSERKENLEITLCCSHCKKEFVRKTSVGVVKNKNNFCSKSCGSSFHTKKRENKIWEDQGRIIKCSDCGIEYERLTRTKTRCSECMYKYWKWNAFEKMIKNKPCQMCGEKNTFLVGKRQAKTCIVCYQKYAAKVGWKITEGISGDMVKKDKFDVECMKCGLQHKTSFYYITCGYGCPECAIGFNPEKPAMLYFMDAGTGWKFGITQDYETRVKYQHEKAHGLKYLEHKNFKKGKQAQQVERMIIKFMKENNLQRKSKTIFQYGGHTEVISKRKYFKMYNDKTSLTLQELLNITRENNAAYI